MCSSPISTSRCIYLEENRCDSAPYGSDFSLALRAVLGARTPIEMSAIHQILLRPHTSENKGEFCVLFR